MIETIATATEMQNDFSRYLEMVIAGNEVIVTINGKEVGRLIPKERTMSYLTDSLAGILNKTDPKDIREQSLKAKCEIAD